jgi:hypothetical protein
VWKDDLPPNRAEGIKIASWIKEWKAADFVSPDPKKYGYVPNYPKPIETKPSE